MDDDANEAFTVGMTMRKYGGSFASNLGEALLHADAVNREKIKSAWPELWEQYLEMSEFVTNNRHV